MDSDYRGKFGNANPLVPVVNPRSSVVEQADTRDC